MYCSKCGARASELEARCAQCGAPLAMPPAEPPAAGNAPGAAPWSAPGIGPAPAAGVRPLVPPPVTPPRPAPAERLLYAGFWRRFFSAVADACVLTPFSYGVQYLMGVDPFGRTEWTAIQWQAQAVLVVVNWLYSSLFECSRVQGTLGQQLLGLRVCDLHGHRIGFGRATGRHFAKILSVLTLGIGFLMIAFTARKQALHDRVAGCLIVRPAPKAVEFTPSDPSPVPGALS